MNASDVISHLRTLPANEMAKVHQWILEQADESQELLAAVDGGLHSSERTGPRVTTRKELETKVRRWAATPFDAVGHRRWLRQVWGAKASKTDSGAWLANERTERG